MYVGGVWYNNFYFLYKIIIFLIFIIIITAFNPTTVTTIDLTSLGIGVLSGGTIYTNRIELNGSGSYFTGVEAITTNLTPTFVFIITSSYSTSFF